MPVVRRFLPSLGTHLQDFNGDSKFPPTLLPMNAWNVLNCKLTFSFLSPPPYAELSIDLGFRGLDPELGAMAEVLSSSESLENAEKHVADYLRALGDHLTFVLKEKLGAGLMRSTLLEFVLTVPAIWSEIAQEKTQMACEKAGLGGPASITLISEPVS